MNDVCITSADYYGRRQEAISDKIEAQVSFFSFIVLDPKDITAHDVFFEWTKSYVDFSTYLLLHIFACTYESK